MFHWHLGPPCRSILRRIAKFYHQKWYYAADSSGQNIHPNILRHTHLFTFMYRSSFSLDTCYLFGLSWYALFVWSCFLDWLILTWLASGKRRTLKHWNWILMVCNWPVLTSGYWKRDCLSTTNFERCFLRMNYLWVLYLVSPAAF